MRKNGASPKLSSISFTILSLMIFARLKKNVEMWVRKRPTLGSQSLPLSTTAFLMIKGQNWAKRLKMVFLDHKAPVFFCQKVLRNAVQNLGKEGVTDFLDPPAWPPSADQIHKVVFCRVPLHP